jgi:HKD family nuclease
MATRKVHTRGRKSIQKGATAGGYKSQLLLALGESDIILQSLQQNIGKSFSIKIIIILYYETQKGEAMYR